MKSKITLIGLFILFTISAKAQFTLSFVATGASSSINKITAINMRSGHSVTFDGNSTLSLKNCTVGIDQMQENSQENIAVYPNPFDESATLECTVQETQTTLISVYNIAGMQVASCSKSLEKGNHQFRFMPAATGVYIIRISNAQGNKSIKLICNKATNNVAKIEYLSNFDSNEKTSSKTLKGLKSGFELCFVVGDNMKYMFQGGNYTAVITDVPANSKIYTVNFSPVYDCDNNSYKTVLIGSQIWFAENLKTRRFSDCTSVTYVSDGNAWAALTTPGMCWCDNDVANKTTYGGLYNWFSVNPIDNGGRNICPTGWHVPTYSEWINLFNFLGGESVAGGKLKEIGTLHWQSPNTGATNSSGFSALPGGKRTAASSTYAPAGTFYYGLSKWWSSSLVTYNPYAVSIFLKFDETTANGASSVWKDGCSIRCLRD